MANYKPIATSIGAGSAASGATLRQSILTTSWGLMLLEGLAKYSTTTLHSAAVNVWEANTATGVPAHTTFTNNLGFYGVTVRPNTALTIKVFAR